MCEYKLKELEYVDGGFRARFTPIDNDIEFFIRNEEGVNALLDTLSYSRDFIGIDCSIKSDEKDNLDPTVQFSRGCIKSKQYPCCWLKRHDNE